jgi:hypothetical protein
VFHILPPRKADDPPMLRLVGRLDRRLNWLGHRIESEEIELAAEAIPGVERAHARMSNEGRLICTIYGNVSGQHFEEFHPIPSIPRESIVISIGSESGAKRKVR